MAGVVAATALGGHAAPAADPDDGREPSATYDCGTLALYALCKLEGRACDLRRLEETLPRPKPTGYSMLDLRDAAGKVGLSLDGVYLKPGKRSPDRPLLVYKKTGRHGHFLVVRPVGHTGTLVQVLDGDNPPEVLDAAELYSAPDWTGLALAPRRPDRLGMVAGGLALMFATVLLIRRWRLRSRGERGVRSRFLVPSRYNGG